MQYIWIHSWMRHFKTAEISQTFGLRRIFTYKFKYVVVSYNYSSCLWRWWDFAFLLICLILSLPNSITKTLGHYEDKKKFACIKLVLWCHWENFHTIWKEFEMCENLLILICIFICLVWTRLWRELLRFIHEENYKVCATLYWLTIYIPILGSDLSGFICVTVDNLGDMTVAALLANVPSASTLPEASVELGQHAWGLAMSEWLDRAGEAKQ